MTTQDLKKQLMEEWKEKIYFSHDIECNENFVAGMYDKDPNAGFKWHNEHPCNCDAEKENADAQVFFLFALSKMEAAVREEIIGFIWEHRTANNKESLFAKFKIKDFESLKDKKIEDLKPFEHGQEGTHNACSEMIEKYGGKTQCCTCTGHKCKEKKI